MKAVGYKSYSNIDEDQNQKNMVALLKRCPIPDEQLLSNLGLFLMSKDLARLMFMKHIYERIIGIHGVVFDMGTRWGQNMAIFAALRGIYEPFNRHRKIVGFDTFVGFPSVTEKDGNSDLMQIGNATCTDNYEEYLTQVMKCHEIHNPASHIQKFEIIKGDAIKTLSKYLERHPETLVSLAYFDFDIYEPTKICLGMIYDRMPKGSVMAFDELCCPDSPGETVAIMELLNISDMKIERLPHVSRVSYMVKE